VKGAFGADDVLISFGAFDYSCAIALALDTPHRLNASFLPLYVSNFDSGKPLEFTISNVFYVFISHASIMLYFSTFARGLKINYKYQIMNQEISYY